MCGQWLSALALRLGIQPWWEATGQCRLAHQVQMPLSRNFTGRFGIRNGKCSSTPVQDHPWLALSTSQGWWIASKGEPPSEHKGLCPHRCLLPETANCVSEQEQQGGREQTENQTGFQTHMDTKHSIHILLHRVGALLGLPAKARLFLPSPHVTEAAESVTCGEKSGPLLR